MSVLRNCSTLYACSKAVYRRRLYVTIQYASPFYCRSHPTWSGYMTRPFWLEHDALECHTPKINQLRSSIRVLPPFFQLPQILIDLSLFLPELHCNTSSGNESFISGHRKWKHVEDSTFFVIHFLFEDICIKILYNMSRSGVVQGQLWSPLIVGLFFWKISFVTFICAKVQFLATNSRTRSFAVDCMAGNFPPRLVPS